MNGNRRNTFFLLGAAALGYSGFKYFPDLSTEELSLETLVEPAGFRRYSAGESSSGFNPFMGLDDGAEDTLVDAERRVRGNICDALYAGNDPSGNTVPVASFSDYYCPFCRVQTKKLAELEQDQASGIRISWHELPLLGEGSNAAAKAALAAKRQGAYVAFHERLMKTPFQPTPEYLKSLAESIGVDHAQLVTDMESQEIVTELENSAALARVFAFVGTPALVIGRTIVQGQTSDKMMLKIIDGERKDGWVSGCAIA